MTEIRFYHLTVRSPDQALPEILGKACAKGDHVVVRVQDEEEAERLGEHLWSYTAESFLPHGTKKDGSPDLQPIWITSGNDNPNNASTEIITDGRITASIGGDERIKLVCDVFDSRSDGAVEAARNRWKSYKGSGHDLTYWKQGEKGWEKAG